MTDASAASPTATTITAATITAATTAAIRAPAPTPASVREAGSRRSGALYSLAATAATAIAAAFHPNLSIAAATITRPGIDLQWVTRSVFLSTGRSGVSRLNWRTLDLRPHNLGPASSHVRRETVRFGRAARAHIHREALRLRPTRAHIHRVPL